MTTARSAARAHIERRFWDDQYAAWDEVAAGLPAGPATGRSGYFHHLLAGIEGGDILSIGGGIDGPAVWFAARGSRVVTVDVSAVACARTEELGRRQPLPGTLQVINAPFEGLTFDRSFDVVIARSALHHMDYPLAVRRVAEVLKPGGLLIAEEPMCLSRGLAWLQKTLPFHPQEEASPTEIKLGEAEVALLRQSFASVEFTWFELLARPSVTYLLGRAGLGGFAEPLRRLDAVLLRRLPPARRICHYAVIRARR